MSSTLSWLAVHGFELSNREWAAAAWLAVLVVVAVRTPDVRSAVISVINTAIGAKLLTLWATYWIWILLFVLIADRVGIWRPVLTKDTMVWSVTAGVVLLTQFTNIAGPRYFRRALVRMLSAVALIQYLLNFASFWLPIELLIQPLLAISVIPPRYYADTDEEKTVRRIRVGLLLVLLGGIAVHSIRELYVSWTALDLSLFALQWVWPMLMGAWVLLLVFPLAIVSNYERAFLRLKMYRNKPTGLWKAKLGLVLALRGRLSSIREAAKGGQTYHVANAESINAAYEEAKRYRDRTIAEKASSNTRD